jgi:hypothetical protein
MYRLFVQVDRMPKQVRRYRRPMRETQPRDGGRGPIAPVLLWLDALTRHLPCCPSGGPKLLVSSESQDKFRFEAGKSLYR